MRRDRHKRKPEGQDNLQDDTFHSAEDSVCPPHVRAEFYETPKPDRRKPRDQHMGTSSFAQTGDTLAVET
jgi:hypothetical protein